MSLSTDSPNGAHSLMVFAEDWGRHPSSCQHLIQCLLKRYDVAWVDTIGMRTPSWNRATFSRGMEKLSHWFRRSNSSPAGLLPLRLTVLQPRMWPWFTRGFDRALNRQLLLSQLRRWCERQPNAVTAVTTLPITADLMGRLPVDRWLYYCVDDFSQWPGVDQRTMQTMERTVIDKADVIIAASRRLQERIAVLGRECHLLTHGVDLEFWRPAASSSLPAELCSPGPPLVVFWGLVDRRMDVDFLRCLNSAMTRGTILLVGPESDPNPELNRIPRVRRVPAQPIDRLPAIGHVSAVLIMPYANLPVTQAIQPLKMLEYLATGKPVVARNLPSTVEWSDCLDVVSSAEEFALTVLKRIDSGTPPEQAAARQRLSQESWEAKSLLFEQWMSGPNSGLVVPGDDRCQND